MGIKLPGPLSMVLLICLLPLALVPVVLLALVEALGKKVSWILEKLTPTKQPKEFRPGHQAQSCDRCTPHGHA